MCVNGLFCSWYKSSQPVAIFNPSTREVRFLTEVDHVDDSKFYFSLGFDPEEKMYKLLMTSTIPMGFANLQKENVKYSRREGVKLRL